MGEEMYQKLKQFYADNGIIVREIHHAFGATAEDYHNAVGCLYEQQAKCLLIKVYAESEYFVMFTIPAQKRADLETVKQIFNARKVRMATRDELKRITGCDFGEVPPSGKLFGIKLLMDKDFLNEREVFLNAGRVDVSFVVNPHDIQRVEDPIMVR